MLHAITGKISAINPPAVIVELSGLAFIIHMPQAASLLVGQEAKLYLHMHWTEDQGPVLYGFKEEYERLFFQEIIGCSGIGPKLAIQLLQERTPAGVMEAVQSNDVKLLNCVPGIGTKKAEQLLIHLRHRVDKLPLVAPEGGAHQLKEIEQVLVSLQYKRQEITPVMQELQVEYQQNKTAEFDYLLRKALSLLAKRV